MNGRVIPKIIRQLALSMIHPERVGPIAGATPMAIPTIPIMVPRFSGGKIDIAIDCPNGVKIPPPRAATIRPVKSMAKLLAQKQIIFPIKNKPIPIM